MSSPPPIPQTTDATRIQVLLAEYAAMQQGIISRTNTRFGILGLVLALIAYLSSPRPGNETFQYIVGMIVLGILLAVWGRLGWLISSCCGNFFGLRGGGRA